MLSLSLNDGGAGGGGGGAGSAIGDEGVVVKDGSWGADVPFCQGGATGGVVWGVSVFRLGKVGLSKLTGRNSFLSTTGLAWALLGVQIGAIGGLGSFSDLSGWSTDWVCEEPGDQIPKY